MVKKVIAGGFFALCGTIISVTACILASQNMVNSWKYSRLLYTILSNGDYRLIFIVGLLMLLGGTFFMLKECSEKNK